LKIFARNSHMLLRIDYISTCVIHFKCTLFLEDIISWHVGGWFFMAHSVVADIWLNMNMKWIFGTSLLIIILLSLSTSQCCTRTNTLVYRAQPLSVSSLLLLVHSHALRFVLTDHPPFTTGLRPLILYCWTVTLKLSTWRCPVCPSPKIFLAKTEMIFCLDILTRYYSVEL